MPPRVAITGLIEATAAAETEIGTIATVAMRGATDTLKTTLRDQVRDAGLGNRLANTWRGKTYPEQGRSLDPAGWVYSNAPDIVTSFATGAAILPHAGHNWLWLPTRNVPRARGAGRATSTKKMTPEQVLAEFHVKGFVFRKGSGGKLLAFIDQARGLTPRGRVKQVARGRLAHGKRGELVLMFTLLAATADPKVLDLQEAADVGAADFVARFDQGLRP